MNAVARLQLNRTDARELETDRTSGFDEFFTRTYANVFRAVLLVTRDREATQDAVGNAFLKALEAWPTVSGHPNPVAWVTRVAVNDSISAWRRIRLQVPLGLASSLTTTDPGATEGVMKALAALPLRQRQVVALRILVGLDTNATADALSIAPGTVTVHLHRALSSIRRRLEDAD
jgi:RNA polymerase sigma-70 factor (ECF subfamily)